MPKRLFDTSLFKKPQFRGLEAPYKLLYLFIKADCDHAGLWDADIDLACYTLKIKIKPETALESLQGLIIEAAPNVWFVTEFIEENYNGILNPKDRVHLSAIKKLEKFFLIENGVVKEKLGANKPLPSPLEGVKDMVIVKSKDMVKDKEEKNLGLVLPENYPWKTETFIQAWQKWLRYKWDQFKFKYKNEESEKEGLIKLFNLSSGSENLAQALIKNSMANTWKGFFTTEEKTITPNIPDDYKDDKF